MSMTVSTGKKREEVTSGRKTNKYILKPVDPSSLVGDLGREAILYNFNDFVLAKFSGFPSWE
jgi:hypothetical protein